MQFYDITEVQQAIDNQESAAISSEDKTLLIDKGWLTAIVTFAIQHKLDELSIKTYWLQACKNQKLTKKDCERHWNTHAAYLRTDLGIEQPAKKTEISVEQLDSWLQDKGIKVSYNLVTHRVNVNSDIDFIAGINEESRLDEIPTAIYNQLKQEQNYLCSRQLVQDYIGHISKQVGNSYNPVLQMLSSITWDGIDRLQAVCEILGIQDEDKLSKTLIRKWFIQAIAMQYNTLSNPYGADGILVLAGGQGIGKSLFAEIIGINSELGKTGFHINERDKDSIIQSTSAFVVELAEIEQTMNKSSAEFLKAFITRRIDEYRVPYGHNEEQHPRHASFIGDANGTDFLVDTTGSRRFWVIPVTVNSEKLKQLNAIQLWKQAFDLYQAAEDKQAAFRLTIEERNELMNRNTKFEKLLPGEQEIIDILESAKKQPNLYTVRFVNSSEFQSYYSTLKKYSAAAIGKALKHLKIEQLQVNSKRGYNLPVRVYEQVPFEQTLTDEELS